MSAPPTIPPLDAANTDPDAGTKYDFARDLIGYGRHPPNAEWPGGAKIAVSFVINYEEVLHQISLRTAYITSLMWYQGAERTVQNGDATSESSLHEQAGDRPGRQGERAFNVESDYEYGSRVGIWRMLNLFEAHNMPITCYAVGQALEKNPAVAEGLIEGGHEVASHAYRWLDYHACPPELERKYVAKQMECLKQLTGRWPAGWYYGRLSPRSKALVWDVYQELAGEGAELKWESDSYCDDLPYWVDVPAEKEHIHPKGMLMLPYTYDNNDLKFHSSNNAFSPDQFYNYLQSAFEVLLAEGQAGTPKMMTIGLHCRIIGKPGRFMALKRFVEFLSSRPKGEVWVATRESIADHWREKFAYQKGERLT